MSRQLLTNRDKEKVRKWAKEIGRKVLWKDAKGFWHAAVDRANTPKWATQIENIKQ